MFLKSAATGVVAGGLLGGVGLAAEAVAKGAAEKVAPKIRAHRTLGRTGFKVSDISSGGPENEGVLAALLDAGVNYIDTAEGYGNGQSERVTGEVLKKRDRKSVFVTTKLVLRKEPTEESLVDRFGKCLERLQTPYVDCLMVHSAATVANAKYEPFHKAVQKLKADGKIRFLGISNHGSAMSDEAETMEQVLLAAVEDGRFDVVLMVYNFLQKEMGERVIKACGEKKIGVTLMKTNPVGAYLGLKAEVETMEKEGKPVPEHFKKVMAKLKSKADECDAWAKANKLENPAEIRDAAVRFALANQGVHTVCASVRNFDEARDFVKLSGTALQPADKNRLSQYSEACGSLYCRHACGACEASCPRGVPVNTVMRYSHYFQVQGRQKYAMQEYASLEGARADACEECAGHCEASCPHGVHVHGLLPLAHRRLTLV